MSVCIEQNTLICFKRNNTTMNKVMLIGNVGKDPDVKYYDADQAVAQFPLATTERGYQLQNGTRVPDRTDWHNIVMWGNLAKIAERYVHKGDRLYVEGKMRYRYYDDKKGQRRFIAEVYADNMELLTPRSAANATADTTSQNTNAAANNANQNAASSSNASIASTEDEDQLPF